MWSWSLEQSYTTHIVDLICYLDLNVLCKSLTFILRIELAGRLIWSSWALRVEDVHIQSIQVHIEKSGNKTLQLPKKKLHAL